jgi:tRNA pseudouridine55 synthase
MFGVIVIDKPGGMTSHDVVNVVRRALGTKKVGHLGTLDPMTTGILPLSVGGATRLLPYFETDKVYEATITFGRTTDSWDADGGTLTEHPTHTLTLPMLTAALASFTGQITQTIPLKSAKHIRGKKLYQYALEGKTIELPTKTVTIHELEVLSFTPDPTVATLAIRVHCSTGTYIRSIAHTLGQQLGTGAYLSALRRTRHGRFDQGVTLPALQAHPNPNTLLQNPLPFLALPFLPLPDGAAVLALQQGKKLELPPKTVVTNQQYVAVMAANPVAVVLAESHAGVKPVKVFAYDQ